MGLIKPKRLRARPVRPYITLRCVVARNQVGWCRGLCRPLRGRGMCGRLAPHALRGRTQLAIAKYEERKDDGGD